MRAVVQRVVKGSVTVENELIGAIDSGLVVLIGVGTGDTAEDARYLAEKIVNLRIFEDEQGKFNYSLLDVKGQLLAVSQFTLFGDCRKGRRPSFSTAAQPDEAQLLYERFVEEVKKFGITVATGRFQAHMLVNIANDGPVTLLLDSKKNF